MEDASWDGDGHSWIFKSNAKTKKERTPTPCPMCYHPLDKWGCCIACERRAETMTDD